MLKYNLQDAVSIIKYNSNKIGDEYIEWAYSCYSNKKTVLNDTNDKYLPEEIRTRIISNWFLPQNIADKILHNLLVYPPEFKEIKELFEINNTCNNKSQELFIREVEFACGIWCDCEEFYKFKNLEAPTDLKKQLTPLIKEFSNLHRIIENIKAKNNKSSGFLVIIQ